VRLLLALLALAAPLAAAAQEAPRRLSLEEALRLAEEGNPAYRSARAELGVADARERESRGAFLPQVSTSLSLGGSANRRWVGTDPFGNPLPSEEAVETSSSYGSQGVSLSFPLFQRGRMGEVRAARAEEKAAGARVRLEAGRLRGEVARRYQEALRAERTIVLEERLLASAAERLEATRRLFRIAAQGMGEVLGAEVEVARQEQAVEEARGETRKAKLALGEALGLPALEGVRLTSEPLAVFDPAALHADTLVALALRAHPRVEAEVAEAAATEHRMGTARGARWPTVDARAGFNRSTFGQDAEGLAILDPSARADRAFSLGFSISLPVFDQFRSSLRTAQADASRTRAREGLRAARLTVEREVRSALIDLENAYRGIRLAERAAKLSKERLELAREQYRLGAIRFIELQTVVDRAAQTEREALRARFLFGGTLALLEEKVGASVRPEE
jgi:outer membrane protein